MNKKLLLMALCAGLAGIGNSPAMAWNILGHNQMSLKKLKKLFALGLSQGKDENYYCSYSHKITTHPLTFLSENGKFGHTSVCALAAKVCTHLFKNDEYIKRNFHKNCAEKYSNAYLSNPEEFAWEMKHEANELAEYLGLKKYKPYVKTQSGGDGGDGGDGGGA